VSDDSEDTPDVARCSHCGGPAHVCALPDSGCRFLLAATVGMRATMVGSKDVAKLLRATENAAWERLSEARTKDHARARAALTGFYGFTGSIGDLAEQVIREVKELTVCGAIAQSNYNKEAKAFYAFREALIGSLCSLAVQDPSLLLEETLAALRERKELKAEAEKALAEVERLKSQVVAARFGMTEAWSDAQAAVSHVVALRSAAQAVVDGGKLREFGDAGTVVEVDLTLMARLIKALGETA